MYMKKILLITGILVSTLSLTTAQVTTAQDFTMSACDATTHSLFADHLDNEEVVIMEFFMTCASCASAASKLSPLQTGLGTQYPGMTNFWVLAYTNSYSCATVTSWKNTNAPNALAFDSGAVQVAYYGGFGMPTTVVVAGSQHQVIYNSNTDGAPGDTAAIHAAIDNFFNTMGVEEVNNNLKFSAYPNPTVNQLNVELSLISSSQVQMEMVDMMGIVIKEISNDNLSEGTHKFLIETNDLANGIYFIRINSGGKSVQYKVSVKH